MQLLSLLLLLSLAFAEAPAEKAGNCADCAPVSTAGSASAIVDPCEKERVEGAISHAEALLRMSKGKDRQTYLDEYLSAVNQGAECIVRSGRKLEKTDYCDDHSIGLPEPIPGGLNWTKDTEIRLSPQASRCALFKKLGDYYTIRQAGDLVLAGMPLASSGHLTVRNSGTLNCKTVDGKPSYRHFTFTSEGVLVVDTVDGYKPSANYGRRIYVEGAGTFEFKAMSSERVRIYLTETHWVEVNEKSLIVDSSFLAPSTYTGADCQTLSLPKTKFAPLLTLKKEAKGVRLGKENVQ